MNADQDQARAEFDSVVREVRPQLLRYCARISGSVVEGEDIVQDALIKAYSSLEGVQAGKLRPWLFRIAHNQAVDHLRRIGRVNVEPLEDEVPDPAVSAPLESHEMARIALSLFLRLTPIQRSCVFLKDVMGHSLEEVGEIHGANANAVKAALHRGRARLRALAGRLDESAPASLDASQSGRLDEYVKRFNARDFDAVRALLADDVRLDLVGRARKEGLAEVAEYFTNYSRVHDWRFGLGTVEGRPAILVSDPREPGADPAYFVLIGWREDRVTRIRDYRYARHVLPETLGTPA